MTFDETVKSHKKLIVVNKLERNCFAKVIPLWRIPLK
jgi:hypothetical protein